MESKDNFKSIVIQKIYNYINPRKLIIGKFLIISGSAVIINLLLLYIFVRYLGFNSPLGQNIANALSMELSVIYNFFLSRSITWKERYREKGRQLFLQLIKFHVTIGITLLFRLGLFALLQAAGMHYMINAAIGIALSAIFNFVAYDSLIFKKEES